MELSRPQKNITKLFYTLHKTPLEETGCLNNLYYFLSAQASSLLIHHTFPNTFRKPTSHCAVLCN